MFTAMAFVALTMGTLSPNQGWMTDYSAAQAKVTVAGKPMAVFVGSGKTGWESAVRDGFDPAVSKLLNEKFVCLYVDSSTTAGKSLAASFQVGNQGIVLSDRTGLTQAYSAAGTVSRAELSRALVAYADVEVAQKTETPKAAPKPVPPAAAPAPMMAPPAYGYAGGYGGGCGTGCGVGCGQSSGCGQSACGTSHGCGFLSKCGFGGFGGHSMGCGQPAPCAQPSCGTSHGCSFLSKCGFGGFCGGGMSHGCGGCK